MWSNIVSVNLAAPSPTPTPTISSTPTPTTKPTLTLTRTPTLTPTPTKIPTPTSKPSLTVSKINNSDEIATDFAKVQNETSGPSQKPQAAVLGASKNNLPFIVISVLGIILFLGAAVLGVYRYWEPLVAWILKE